MGLRAMPCITVSDNFKVRSSLRGIKVLGRVLMTYFWMVQSFCFQEKAICRGVFVFVLVLGIEHKVLYMLGKCSTIELHSQPPGRDSLIRIEQAVEVLIVSQWFHDYTGTL